MRRRNNLQFYGFRESSAFVPKYIPKQTCESGVSVEISKEDGNIITIGKDGGIVATLALEIENEKLSLVNTQTGFKLSTVDIPGADCVKDLSFEWSNGILTVLVTKNNGQPAQNYTIDLGSVVNAYTAGDGINISDDNEISVKLAQDGGIVFNNESELELDDSKVANQDEIDNVTEDIENLYYLVDVVSGDVEDVKDDIESLSGAVEDINDELEEINERLDNVVPPDGSVVELSHKLDEFSANTEAEIDAIEGAIEALDAAIDDLEDNKLDKSAYTEVDLSTKQDTLVSGVNIKTVNEISLLGEGNVDAKDVIYMKRSGDEYHEALWTNNRWVYSMNPINGASGKLYLDVDSKKLYMYTNDFIELNGQQDLSNYYNKTETDTLLEGKLDATAYTPTDLSNYYNKTEVDDKLDDKLDATAYTPTDLSNYYDKDEVDGMLAEKADLSVLTENERVVSEALNDLNNRKLDASAYTPTDLSNYYTKDETYSVAEVNELLDGKASNDRVDGLEARIDSLPDMSWVETEIENKADQSDVDALSGMMDNFVTQTAFTESQNAQNLVIDGKAEQAAVSELNDKLGAIVGLNNIVEGENGYEYIPTTTLNTSSKVVDHVQYLLHAMTEDVDGLTFDENAGCVALLTKLMALIDGLSGDDIVALNTKLKNL